MSKEFRNRAIQLYKPPFKYLHGLIHDSNHQIVANDNVLLGLNGWGRLQNVESGDQILAEVGEMIAEAVTQYWESEQKKLQN